MQGSLLVDGEVTQDVITSLGRYLRLVRDDLSDTVGEPDETATEAASIIAREPADSLLDEESGGEDGQRDE